MNKIVFFIDKDLGLTLALWALRQSAYKKTKIYVLTKRENWKYFTQTRAIILRSERGAFNINPDIIFSINYWKKIESKFVQRFKIINLHHSYNLIYRGRHTCTWAIINARRTNNWTHGTTLHIIDKTLDSGEIICSYKCPILESDSAYSLFLRVEKLAKKMFKENFGKILSGNYSLSALPAKRFYYRESDLNHYLDLNLPVIDIYDRVRALTFPGKPLPYMIIRNQRIELIWKGK